MNASTPPWPSLYNPAIEILHIAHRDPTQPAGHYLYDASAVYRFTLYWTLIFYTPTFALCGIYAFLNITFPPSPLCTPDPETHPLTSRSSRVLPAQSISPPRQNPRRTRFTYALLVLFVFLAAGVLGAVLGSAVIGFVLTGLFKAAKFNMSTWFPFVFAFIQTLIGIFGAWPSVIEII